MGCPFQDRYTISASYTELSDSQKLDFQERIPDNGRNNQVIILNLFFNSMEYQKIKNFPQHGLQFLAEVGGLMAFFLGKGIISPVKHTSVSFLFSVLNHAGISVVSIFECICYAGFRIKAKCCNCSICGEDEEDPAAGGGGDYNGRVGPGAGGGDFLGQSLGGRSAFSVEHRQFGAQQFQG